MWPWVLGVLVAAWLSGGVWAAGYCAGAQDTLDALEDDVRRLTKERDDVR